MEFAIAMMILIICLAVFFAPVIIAVARRHNSTVAIFLMTLFLGWTILFWLIALIWSGTGNVRKE